MTAQQTSGYRSAAQTYGHGSAAQTSGHGSAAQTSGHGSAAQTSGHRSAAQTYGYGSAAQTSGHGSAAQTSGDGSAAQTYGYGSAAQTSGDGSAAQTSGDGSAAQTSGDGSAAQTSGDRSDAVALQDAAQTEGRGSVAIGRQVRLTGNGMDAVVLPVPGRQPFIVSVADGWPEWQWISMNDDGTVTADPDLLLPNDGRTHALRWTNGRYVAGCRTFTYEQAVAHWSNPDHQAPGSAARLLAEVERHHEATS